jgi:predicted helicase
LYGKREDKYDFLSDDSVSIRDFAKIEATAPYYFFVPKDFSGKAEYDKGFGMRELFVVSGSGIETKNDSVAIHYSRSELEKSLSDFRSMPEDELIFKYPKLQKEGRDWKRRNFLEDAKDGKGKITPVTYRPFDTRFTYYTGKSNGFMCRPSRGIMQHMLKENIALLSERTINQKSGIGAAFVCNSVSDGHTIGTRSYLAPLYLYSGTDNTRTPNFSLPIVEKIADKLKLQFTHEKTDEPNTFAPIDVLDYIYAVLHSPKYCKKYREFLKIDFPRVPYPTNRDDFWHLVKFGERLRRIQLLESEEPAAVKIGYSEIGDNIVHRVKYSNNRVYINDTQYFDNVLKIAWEFYVGGYQLAQKWLKDRRGRCLNYDDVVHYGKIINALYITDRIMQEIDEKIDTLLL